MFETEARIQAWKSDLLARESLRADVVAELEDHLREVLAELPRSTSGGRALLTDEEAFLIATRRVGRVDALADEFERVEPGAAWRRRWIWMLCGYLGGHFAFQAIITVAAVAFGLTRNNHPTLATVLYAAIVAISLVAVYSCAKSAKLVERFERLLAPSLRTTTGVVVAGIVALLASAAITPIGMRFVEAGSFGIASSAESTFESTMLQGSRLGLWAAPFVALAVLVRIERTRREAQANGTTRAS